LSLLLFDFFLDNAGEEAVSYEYIVIIVF
jgi:hypothetical protein